jgi:hypothetical protein
LFFGLRAVRVTMTEAEIAQLGPEQREILKRIDELTNTLSKTMDGQARNVCLGALLNNIGFQMQELAAAGDAELLMRVAVGCQQAADMAAGAVHRLEGHAPH